MEKRNKHWNAYLSYEKILLLAGLILIAASVVFLVVYLLQVFGVFQSVLDAYLVADILMVAGMICSTIGQWRRNRALAYPFLLVAIVSAVRLVFSVF